MALWSMVCDLPPELFSGYSEEFPRNLRCLLGDWLEKYPWEFITGTDPFNVFMANSLFSAMIEKLQDLVNKNCQPGLILQLTANLENAYRSNPLYLARTVKQILDSERVVAQNTLQGLPLSFHRQQEELKFGFDLKQLHYKLQEIQNHFGHLKESSRVSLQMNTVDPKFSVQGDLKANSLQTLRTLFSEVTKDLETTKNRLLKRLDIWKRQQQLAGNGTPFDEDLAPLQKRFESLIDVYFQLHQQLVALAVQLDSDFQSCLQKRLESVFSTLIKSAFLVDKQPPQVLKTQTKFQATVRFLLGCQLFKALQTSFSVTANIVTEKSARDLATGRPDTSLNESSGEIMNNITPLETTTTSNACCAVFKNMLLKKIRRSDRKGTESVTEEKCAVLFSARINLGSNNTFLLQALSLPIVVIVHGNQDNNAKATILWDNAFAVKDRIPFVVTERVPWGSMCETLNQKFMAEVQTAKGLDQSHYFFLAQKIFNDNSASLEDFQSRCVSWSQFNKEILPGRGFTFWQWFEGILDLTKKYLRDYWSDGLIMGFVSKQAVSNCLSNAPGGTFLLRFSDSLIGGISIAYVIRFSNGSYQVENIQPFTATSLSVRSLADCVRDLQEIQMLYPEKPKTEAFQKYFNEELPRKNNKEYVPTRMMITVGIPSDLPSPEQMLHSSMPSLNKSPRIHTDPVYPDGPPLGQNLFLPNPCENPGIPADLDHSQMVFSSVPSPVYYENPMMQNEWTPPENMSPLGEPHLVPQDSDMDFIRSDLVDIMECSMQLDPSTSENLHAPSPYELEQLMQQQQPLLHYSHSSGPTLTNLCS